MEDKIFELMEKMYREFTGFKSEMLEFKDDMTGFKSEMLEFKSETSGRLDKLDQGYDTLNKSVIRVENQLTEKVTALFDARDVMMDKLEKIDVIEEKVDKLTLAVLKNDNEMTDLKRKLKSV